MSNPYDPPSGDTPPPQQPPPPPEYGQPPAYGQAPPPGYGAYPPPPPFGDQPYGHTFGEQHASQLASWIRRVGGRIIDGIIFGGVPALIGLATSRVLGNLLSLVGLLILGYLNGARGVTPGKSVVGVRLVRDADGQLLGGGMGIVREIAHILDSLACLVGWLWPLWDKKRQTFADKICSTVVVTT